MSSASVYSLTLTKQLSHTVVGPLVPASMLLCVALCLLPLSELAQTLHLASALRALIVLAAAYGMRAAARGAASKKAS